MEIFYLFYVYGNFVLCGKKDFKFTYRCLLVIFTEFYNSVVVSVEYFVSLASPTRRNKIFTEFSEATRVE